MTGRRDRLSKHPDGGKGMIDRLKKLGWWAKLTKAKPRVTDSGHRVGQPTDEDEI
jgi:hypothetical protein